MEQGFLELIKISVVFMLPATTCLIALRMYLGHRARTRGTSDTALEALLEENAALRADFDARVTELEERVNFVERRLVQEGDRPQLPSRSRIPTPV